MAAVSHLAVSGGDVAVVAGHFGGVLVWGADFLGAIVIVIRRRV
jgi:hypothetical protein